MQNLCSELQETLLLRLVGDVGDCTGEGVAGSSPRTGLRASWMCSRVPICQLLQHAQ